MMHGQKNIKLCKICFMLPLYSEIIKRYFSSCGYTCCVRW